MDDHTIDSVCFRETPPYQRHCSMHLHHFAASVPLCPSGLPCQPGLDCRFWARPQSPGSKLDASLPNSPKQQKWNKNKDHGDCCRCNGLATPCINLAGQYWSILHLAKMRGTSFQGPHCTEITFSCTTWRFFINKMLRQSMANCHYKRKEHLFDACVAHHDVLKVFLTAWYYLDNVAALPSEQEPFYLTCTNLPKEPWQLPVLLHLLPVARMAVQCSVGCGVVALSGRTLSVGPLSRLGQTQNTQQQYHIAAKPISYPAIRFYPYSNSNLNSISSNGSHDVTNYLITTAPSCHSGWDVSTVLPRDPTRRMLRRTEAQSPMGFCHLTNRNANVELPRPQWISWLVGDGWDTGMHQKNIASFVWFLS